MDIRIKLLVMLSFLGASVDGLAARKSARPATKKTVKKTDLERALELSLRVPAVESQDERDLRLALEASEQEHKRVLEQERELQQAIERSQRNQAYEDECKRAAAQLPGSLPLKPKKSEPKKSAGVPGKAAPYTSPYARRIRVAKQDNAECGYHAVINTATAVAKMTGLELPRVSLQDLKNEIKRRSPGRINDQWLDTQEVEFLAQDVYRLPAYAFTVIGDITSPLSRRYLSEQLIHAIEQLQKSDGYSHGFIVGNMQQEEGGAQVSLQDFQKRVNLGHWISVMARRENGHIYYDVRNSLSSSARSTVNALIALVEANPAQLWLQSESLMLEKLNQIDRALESGFHAGMIRAIGEIVSRANMVAAGNRGNFYNPQNLAGLLLAIPDDNLTEEQMARKQALLIALEL